MGTAIVGAIAAVFGTALGVWLKRARTLDSQRADFQALIEPLQKEVDRLFARVESLERERDADRKWRWIAVQYIRDLLTWGQPLATPQNPVPVVPPEISGEVVR